MKSLFVKIGTGIVALAAIFGINLSNANASISYWHLNNTDTKSVISNEITEQTPLYLYHANQKGEIANNLLTWHYSHQSHASHASHQSHYSHYSGS